MNQLVSSSKSLWAVLAASMLLIVLAPARAAEPSMLDQDARAALQSLYAGAAGAKALGDGAKAVLVFPNVVKAGFVVGGQSGDGVLMVKGKTVGYYNTTALSVGLQAGAQSFGYALFFMTDKVLDDFKKSKNFQIGVGPTVVVMDAGAAKDISNLTAKANVYAVIFDQQGLMAGVGLQGSKITRLDK